MRKIILWIAIPVVLIVLVVVLFFAVRNSQGYRQNSAFRAVPELSPLIVEIPSVESLLEQLKDPGPALGELRQVKEMDAFWKEIDGLRQLMNKEPALGDVLRNKCLLGAFNTEGKNNIGCVWVFSLKNRSEKLAIETYLQRLSAQHKIHLSTRTYDQTTVYQLRDGEEEYSLAEHEGIFIFSRYSILVDEAIRQISAVSLMENPSFKHLYATVGHDSDFNLYLNHQTLAQLLVNPVNSQFRKYVQAVQTYADWTELDVNLTKKAFLFSGFTFSKPQNTNYINLFRKQEPARFQMDEVLPANTSLFVNIHLSDFQQFQNDYVELLKKQHGFYTRDTRFIRLEKYTHKKFIPFWEEFLDNDFAGGFLNVLKNDPTGNRFFVARVKSRSLAEQKLLPLLKDFAAEQKMDFNQQVISYQIQGDREFTIYPFPIADLPDLLFGKFFSGVASNYLCFYDNYLIFTDNLSAMKQYLHNMALSATLSRDAHFEDFNSEMASQSSVYFYLNFYRLFNLKQRFLADGPARIIANNENGLRKFYALGWQFGANSEEFLNNGYLNYVPDLKEEPHTVWQSKLDGPISMKPQLVINHHDRKKKEIIVEDEKHSLYLLSNDGVILWKLRLPEPIMGKIYQVDYYRNDKLQYLFNTKDKIYLIDRNGNRVGHFPVNLRAEASNGVAVLDYNRNRDYRYVVAGTDRKIYVYDRDGRIVPGWKVPQTEEIVENPVQFFRIEDKDYLVCADRYKTYIFNRRGEVGVNVRDHFEHSGNLLYLCGGTHPSLATTDQRGTVHLQYFDGHFETVVLKGLSSGHTFEADDLSGDGQTEFIATDKNRLLVYSFQGNKIVDNELDGSISGRPVIYTFSPKDKRIGLVCKSGKEVYLFHADGKLIPGFPLQGATDFTIGYLNQSNPYFNLIVGSSDGEIFNYQIESQ